MSSVMLVSVRPQLRGAVGRDCLLSWLAVATTFDGLNVVDSRSGEFKMAQIQKIDRARVSWGTASDRLCVNCFSESKRAAASIGDRQHHSEMFRDRRTPRQ